MNDSIPAKLWMDWRLHLLVLVIVIISESIGTYSFSIGPGVLLVLPIIYAFIIGLGLYFTPIIKEKQSKNSESIVIVGVSLLLAKIGITIGPILPEVIAASPALFLQELGNLATIAFGLPIALWIGLKRETIGMTHSLSREANIGLIVDKYGINSPEGRGVMAIYIFGTVFGAVFLGLVAGLLVTVLPLHPYSLAMASGVGSSVMMTAASGSLIEAIPEMEDQILAFAGTSNLLSLATGLYVSIFVALPLTEKLYSLMTKKTVDKEYIEKAK